MGVIHEGDRYGRLTVIERTDGVRRWICRCDCGNVITVCQDHLRSGHIRSCGCLRKELTSKRVKRHGDSHTQLHNKWCEMNSRCNFTHGDRYGYYKGRGIRVCEEWKSYEAFKEWSLKNGWEPGLSLDRIDNDGPYSPDNCRWVPFKQQCRNRSTNVKITIGGETHILTEWLEMYNVSKHTYYSRLHMGWNQIDAITKPVAHKHNKSKG